jgi:hypothetical protein
VASTPYRVRFRVPLTALPVLTGVAAGAPLWGQDAEPEFFAAATHVLAIGAVGMALTGNAFRLAIHRAAGPAGTSAMLTVILGLGMVGLGLGFAFHALAVGHAGPADVPFVVGSLATGIAAFGVQAMFGVPGVEGDAEPSDAAV